MEIIRGDSNSSCAGRAAGNPISDAVIERRSAQSLRRVLRVYRHHPDCMLPGLARVPYRFWIRCLCVRLIDFDAVPSLTLYL
jgi:hypothetical protein